MKAYKKCQSCAMSLKNPEDRGTKKNHDASPMYCKHCYLEGNFIHNNVSADEMEQLVKVKCVNMGMPKLFAGIFARGIHKLERWK